ncbi:MAG: hypothetical protein P4L85_12220 [Paludisphaera borealis]|uniref:hypothetical protein n=1 Tax=Paludisphaera borealis TaxID=1387353 RepID=UPI002841FBCB|nr:hypothetical protein [Paludisphaera borealis]MDR3620109.1 hypothetical protein [Paludisphaera borealis]
MSDAAFSVNAVPSENGVGTLELATRAARDGAADASEAAAQFWANSSLMVSRLLYNTAYTLSYGVVFPVAYVARAIPSDNAAVQGVVEGAEAAARKVDDLLNRP